MTNPAKNYADKTFSSPMHKLIWVMQCLRDKKHGCPWDIEQDFKSILPYTIEEAYEVADAIERNDMNDLREELGDLLLQVVYHTQMASEASEFTFDEVALGVADKMISRHPHVFGDITAANSKAVDVIWDAQKDKENNHKGQKGAHTLDSVTLGLPALLRAQKLQKKAAKTGFEWPNAKAAFDKLNEEIMELKEALESDDKTHQEEELGDMLFCIVNFARMKGLNAEEALRKANNKFVRRFSGLEDDFRNQSKDLNDATLEQMLNVWDDQKKKD